ncbi:MAG: Ldh family oxidoreductase, partial [Chloroflexota bacterium]
MLERFKVPPEDAVRVPEQSLRSTVVAIFEKMGVPHQGAAEGADVLVMTDLRGVETHGVSNMLRRYVQDYKEGRLNPRPQWTILRESPATATIDADGGLGIILGGPAMQLAIQKARNTGVGVVTMYNSGHMGAIGHFAMMAAQQDMVGICMTALSIRV